jgi:hypothetical protein
MNVILATASNEPVDEHDSMWERYTIHYWAEERELLFLPYEKTKQTEQMPVITLYYGRK